jgi:AGZA family xanthine/uracil permease-like MFS transporter
MPLQGTGPITYGEALAAVFLEGLIFFALTVFGLRQWLARLIPRSIALAIGAGIGLFLTLIGLSSSGLGVVQGATATPLQIGGCLPEFKDETGICVSHVLQDPKMWLGIFAGGVVTAFLLLYRVKGESTSVLTTTYFESDQNFQYCQVPFFGPSSSSPSARGLETPA